MTKTLQSSVRPVTSLARRHVAWRATALGLAVALAGCMATKPVNPNQWTTTDLPDTDVMPAKSAITEIRRTRVVVLPSDDSPSAPRGAGLANVASASLESMLGAGGVEVVERNLATKLDQELKLAEMRGAGSYGGPEVADYAIRVVMGPVVWNSTYVQATTFKNPVSGNPVTLPAGYNHVGTSTMTLRVYQLPSLRLLRSISVEGKATNDRQPVGANTTHSVGLVTSATATGVKSKQDEVLNEFAPKGYVSERRIREKESIFRVNLGRQTGAKSDETVEFYSLQPVKDMAGKESYDDIPLGTGRMTNIVSESGSWVQVDDEKVARAIRRGDFVRIKREGCGFTSWRECMAKIKLPL